MIQDQEKDGGLLIRHYASVDIKDGILNRKRNPENEFTRSHMDLSKIDYASRYPRPEPFDPRWK